MSEPRNPAPGPLSRDPTAAARLLAAASDVSLRVERARNDVEWLAHATSELARSAGVPPQAPPSTPQPEPRSDPDRARQLAIDLAVGGTPRELIGDDLALHVERAGRERADAPAGDGDDDAEE